MMTSSEAPILRPFPQVLPDAPLLGEGPIPGLRDMSSMTLGTGSEDSKQVAHLELFGLEVLRVVRVGFGRDGDPFDNLQTVSLQADHFLWIVG